MRGAQISKIKILEKKKTINKNQLTFNGNSLLSICTLSFQIRKKFADL